MKIKPVFFISLLLSLVSCAKKPEVSIPTEEDMQAYLFTFYTDATHSIHMAISHDGYTFTALNDGYPVIAGDTIADQKGVRDPHLYRGPDGSFYMVMTDLHIFAKEKGYRETEWERPDELYGWGNNRGFVFMKSTDLINWTRHNVFIEDLFPQLENIGCAWAPQTIYDTDEDKLMVYFSMRFEKEKTKLYYAYADDEFTKLSTMPKLMFGHPNPEIQVLDGDITQMPDGNYCLMYVAQEHPGGIKMAISNKLNSGYVYQPDWIDFEPGASEAPSVWKRINEDKWVLMYDIHNIAPNNYGFCETTDFLNFNNIGHLNEGDMKISGITLPKQGAVIHITAKEAERLEKYWKKNKKKYVY